MCIFGRIACPVNNVKAVKSISYKDFGMIPCTIFVRKLGNQGQKLQKLQN